ncbi:hypothetical protein ACU686_03755 [Yinghuangia aomiensis]
MLFLVVACDDTQGAAHFRAVGQSALHASQLLGATLFGDAPVREVPEDVSAVERDPALQP